MEEQDFTMWLEETTEIIDEFESGLAELRLAFTKLSFDLGELCAITGREPEGEKDCTGCPWFNAERFSCDYLHREA